MGVILMEFEEHFGLCIQIFHLWERYRFQCLESILHLFFWQNDFIEFTYKVNIPPHILPFPHNEFEDKIDNSWLFIIIIFHVLITFYIELILNCEFQMFLNKKNLNLSTILPSFIFWSLRLFRKSKTCSINSKM